MRPLAIVRKRPKLPTAIHLHAVAPGNFTEGQAGTYVEADTQVAVHIEHDPNGVFEVVRMDIYDLEPVEDLPPGHHALVFELVHQASIDGPGPVSVSAGEAVVASVRFTAPLTPAQASFAATVVMVAANASTLIRIPVTATAMHVAVHVITPSFQITQGSRANANLLVKSLSGSDTEVNFFMTAAPQGVFLDPGVQTFPLPANGVLPVDLAFLAQSDAPLGIHELQGLEFDAFGGEQKGEFDLDHQITVNVIPSPKPPPPDPHVDHFDVIWVPGSTQRICQLTGAGDPAGLPHPNNTTRFDLLGTDLGISVDHKVNGEHRTYFFFGDTNSKDSAPGGDAIAYTVDNDPEPEGTHLRFIMGDNQWRRLTIPGVSLDIFEVPTGAFSHADRLFVFATTDNFGIRADGQQMGRSVLASAPDPQGDFERHYDVSNFRTDWRDDGRGGGKFINVSPCTINNDDWRGVPVAGRGGRGVLMMGSGKYHMSPPYLAYVTLLPGQIPPKSAWRYLQGFLLWEPGFGPNGPPGWSESEDDATPLFDANDIGELSFGFNEGLQRWIVVYNGCVPGRCGILLRSAPFPWGPWSEPRLIFEAKRDGAQGVYIFECGPYGPYVIDRYNRWDAASKQATIYYTLSNGGDCFGGGSSEPRYQVHLMKSKLQLISKP